MGMDTFTKQNPEKPSMMRRQIAIAMLSAAVPLGCTATHVSMDARSLRGEVKGYYEEEIMDNLVRAANGQFFVHVDVSALNTLVSSKLAGNVGGGQTSTNTSSTQKTNSTLTTNTGTTTTAATISNQLVNGVAGTVGVVSTVTGMMMRPFTYSISPERDNTINLNAGPVIDDRNVYDAYIHFINLSASSESWETYLLNKTNSPALYAGEIPQTDAIMPPPVRTGMQAPKPVARIRTRCRSFDDTKLPAVISLQRSGYMPNSNKYVDGTLRWPTLRDPHWYWVPKEFKEQYFDLCMELVGRLPKPSGGNSALNPPPTISLD